MKTASNFILFLVLASLALPGCATNRSMAGMEGNSSYAGTPVSIDIFYQSLSPYGRWISYPQYGQVWIPGVGNGFEPYSTNGHWVYTNYGWTWASDYSWGWAPFHYGRWLFDDYYGWIWVPGTQWAPAWVAWRNSADYYGWAPLAPGVNISINIGIPASRWIFVPRHYFGDPYAHRYYLPRRQNVYIINNTTIINNTHVYQNNRYFSGPARLDVERSTRRTVRPVRVSNSSEPGATRVNNRELNIYRPALRASDTRTAPAQNNDARPQRTAPASGNRETPATPENREGRPERVFRGQENNRTTPPSEVGRPERSRTATPPARQESQPQPADNRRPANEQRNTSPRVFRQEPASRQPAQAPRTERSNTRRAAPERVQRETSPSRTPARETRTENNQSRPGRR